VVAVGAHPNTTGEIRTLAIVRDNPVTKSRILDYENGGAYVFRFCDFSQIAFSQKVACLKNRGCF
jgi:hypothetical protein